MTSNQPVTPQYLLEGACAALQQCGFLLYDAIALYTAESYATSIVLAAFAREELGRYRILGALYNQVVAGETVTISQIKKQCQDHVKKQDAAQTSTMLRFLGDSELGRLVRRRMKSSPQSDDFREASRQLDRITQKKRKRTPSDRHQTREAALYVEPDASGVRWNTPRTTFNKEDALEFITEAIDDYAVVYQHTNTDSQVEGEDQVLNALRQWDERPDFLPPPFDRIGH